jgi:SAM-dependent methyltransferase
MTASASDDRERWDARHRQARSSPRAPSPFLYEIAHWLPAHGRALDVAGGAGTNAVWLARRGLEVTLADLSPVALELAEEAALQAGTTIRTLEVDLEREPLPSGSWDLVLCVRFLWRPRFAEIPQALSPGGLLMVVHPTRSNLLRHERPGLHHLLEDGELPSLVRGLEIVHFFEGWTDEGHHEARLLARRVAVDGTGVLPGHDPAVHA